MAVQHYYSNDVKATRYKAKAWHSKAKDSALGGKAKAVLLSRTDFSMTRTRT